MYFIQSLLPIKSILSAIVMALLFNINVRPEIVDKKSSGRAINNCVASITPESFGCKGDSITDDTEKLQNALNYCKKNNRVLKSVKGKIYAISAPLDFGTPNEMQVDFGGARIKAITPMNYMIVYNNESDFSIKHNNIINNLVLDCNNISGGIYCQTAIKTSFQFIMIRNCSKKAFTVENGYEVFFTNSHIHCTAEKDTYGIYLKTGDNHFDNVVVIDAHTAVYQKTQSVNFFDKVHAWLFHHVEGSIFFNISGLALLNQCYCDTAEKGYHIHDFAILKLVNCHYYNNPECYDSKNNPVIFSFATEVLSQMATITCSNCNFNSGGLKVDICNFKKQRIQFEQCLIDPSIRGYCGKFSPIPTEGVIFNRAIGTIEDNNNCLNPENDRFNRLYLDAEIGQQDGASEINIAKLPSAYLPSRVTYGMCVMIWSDGTYTPGCVNITREGMIKVRKNNNKTVKRIIFDITFY